MKRAFLVYFASLLISGVSSAGDRVLLRREYYYNSNPEIRRVVGEIDERRNQELTELHHEIDKAGPGAWAELYRHGTQPGGPSWTEIKKRADEAGERYEKVEVDYNAEVYAVLERTTPYVVLECVVAPGGIEAARGALWGEQATFRVGLSGFEEGMPWLFVSSKRDGNHMDATFVDEMPRPFPLNVSALAERLGFGSKDPVQAAFQRAWLAPEYRPNGCTVKQPGGEAPPPTPPRPRNQMRQYYPVPASQKSW